MAESKDAVGRAAYALAEETAQALKLEYDLTWTKASICDPEFDPPANILNGCTNALGVTPEKASSMLFPLVVVNIDIRGLPLTNSASHGGAVGLLMSDGPTIDTLIERAGDIVGKEVKLALEGNSGGGALVAILAWAESVD
jgi:hypothetical protein